MIFLRQSRGEDTGREFHFVQAVVRIGRMPDSDVNFDPEADLDASGRHAEIRFDGTGYLLVDVGSRNGTWLNGDRTERAHLHEGDEVEFGVGGPRLIVTRIESVAQSDSPSSAGARGLQSRPADNVAMPSTVQHPVIDDALSPSMPATFTSIKVSSEPARSAMPTIHSPPDTLRSVPREVMTRWIAVAVAALSVWGLVFWWVHEHPIQSRKNAAQVGADAESQAVLPTATPTTSLQWVDVQRQNLVRFAIDADTTPCVGVAVAPDVVATSRACAAELVAAGKAGKALGAERADGSRFQLAAVWDPSELAVQREGEVLGGYAATLEPFGFARLRSGRLHAAMPRVLEVGALRIGDQLTALTADGVERSVTLEGIQAIEYRDVRSVVLRLSSAIDQGTPMYSATGAMIALAAGPSTPSTTGAVAVAVHAALLAPLIENLSANEKNSTAWVETLADQVELR